ncbi:MAG: APC family permease [Thermoprotei archaeon]
MNSIRLKQNALSLWETYGQAMAVTAPLGSVVSTTTAAVLYVGSAVPLATLLAFMASVVWLAVLTAYSKRIASAGGFYSFAGFSYRRKWISFFEAVTEVSAFVTLNAADVFAVYLMLKVIEAMLSVRISLPLELLIASSALWYPTAISLLNIKVVIGKFVSWSATAEVALLSAFFFYSALTRGFSLDPLSPSGVGSAGFMAAFLLSLTSISGAGTSTYLGEETSRPTRNVTAGMWLALVLGGIAMFLGSYAMVIDWGPNLDALASSPQPLLQEMGKVPMVGGVLLLATFILALNSILSSNVGTTVAPARVLFNLARERAAPANFLKLNRFFEPLMGTILVGIVSAGLAGGYLTLGVDAAFAQLSLLASFFWMLGRTVDALGVPLLYRRVGAKMGAFWIVTGLALVLSGVAVTSVLTPVDPLALAGIAGFVLLTLTLYLIYGRKGKPGSVYVDERGELKSWNDGDDDRCMT